MGTRFSSAYTVREYHYTDWKSAFAARGGSPQADASDGVYQKVWFYDGPEIHTCVMWLPGAPVTAEDGYTQQQNDADLADYTSNVAPFVNLTVQPKLSDGRIRQSAEKTSLTRVNIYSHDWTDPTSWYGQSVYAASETATDSGDHTKYTLAHKNVIDTFHGKLTGEDFIIDAMGYSYRVAVTVNGVSKVEQDPHLGAGGDFTVDYSNGAVNFLVANQATDVVAVTYHYATGSTFVVAPTAGQSILIDSVEVQFSGDIEITDTVVFQPYGLVDVFAHQLVAAGTVPSGTKIPLGNPVVYKSVGDFQNDATKAYPVYPAMGGSGWRGCPQPMIIFNWDYVTSTELRADYGMEIRISLEHDVPFGGFYATATFYCMTEPL